MTVGQCGLDLDRVALPAGVIAFQRLPLQQRLVADAQPRLRGQPGLRVHAGLQQVAQTRRRDGLARQTVLQFQVETRHVDAARIGMGQVHRQVDAGGHLQLPTLPVR